MKRFHITGSLSLLLFLFACSHQNQAEMRESGDEFRPVKGEIRFMKSEHDLGTITQGEKVGYTFAFTNSGDASLVILDASASCGCTVPRFSREPVPPGENGSVEVIFDSAGRIGQQSKTVTIKTNGKVPVFYLTIKANIIKLNS